MVRSFAIPKNKSKYAEIIDLNLDELTNILCSLTQNYTNTVIEIANAIIECFLNDRKILVVGNGGSAADAQHFAGEFSSSFNPNIKRSSLPVLALTTNTSLITAYANDHSYEGIFSRQVEGLGKRKDILITFSTSGKSKNCLNAVKIAKEMGMTCISFTKSQSPIGKLSDIVLDFNSKNTQRLQEMHVFSYHTICEMVELVISNQKAVK